MKNASQKTFDFTVSFCHQLTVGVLDIYGRNVVTTEGAEWRMHRKITSRPFSEKNNQLVHDESVRQTIQMMASWESQSKNGSFIVEK
jgi:cytochrome P450